MFYMKQRRAGVSAIAERLVDILVCYKFLCFIDRLILTFYVNINRLWWHLVTICHIAVGANSTQLLYTTCLLDQAVP